MRDAVFVFAVAAFIAVSAVYPYGGALTWGWLTFMNPQQLLYGFAYGWPFNLAVAVVTAGAWIVSGEKKSWPRGALPVVMVLLVAWITFNAFFAADPDWSWPLWSRTVKIFTYIFLAFSMARTKARIQSMVWVLVLSIGFFGIKGGVFTIITGGNYKSFGPENSIIYDNNHLALAIVVVMPLVIYLRTHTRQPLIRLGLTAALPFQIISVLGSYSRGGTIALFIMLSFFWTRSRRKLLYLVIGVAVLGGSLALMPPAFFERMQSVKQADQDDSFMGRVTAWKVASLYALEHFPFGAGLSGPERRAVFNHYFPEETTHAAHSIYFQMLGDNGFPGLFLFLLIAALSLRNCSLIVRQCALAPELAWARDLGSTLQISLISFFIGGAALSMDYFDGYLMLQALSTVLRELTRPGSQWGREASKSSHSAKREGQS